MAGIVTKTGADLIKQARELVERIEDLLSLILMVSGAFYHRRFQKITNLHLRTVRS